MPSFVDKMQLNRKQDRRARFTDKQVSQMRDLYKKGYTQKAIAEIFGTRQSTVCYIVSHKTHNHLAEYRRENPSKRRTKEEACKYMQDLRTYKKKLIKKGGDSDA